MSNSENSQTEKSNSLPSSHTSPHTSLRSSNFAQVKTFMETAGQKVEKTLQYNIFEENPKLVQFRMDLIQEELKETLTAIKNNDIIELMDGLGDLLYVIYGAGHAFGIDLDKVFSIVQESNMSKFCKTEQEAKETVAWYKKQYDAKESVYDSPDYKVVNSTAGELYVVYNKSTGKILKNINYKKVNFFSLLPENIQPVPLKRL